MDDSKPNGGWCRLGILIPAVTLAFFSADVALRKIPLDYFSFRAWEPLAARAAKDGPFAANERFVNERSYGDLASLGNRPDLRQYRPERFTTDRWGFRNDPDLLKDGPADAVLIGDSFAVGAGLCDDEILSVQLSRAGGLRVYNGAGPRITQRLIENLARNLQMSRGVVLHEMVVHEPLREKPPPVWGGRPRPLTIFALEGFLEVSRLKLVLNRLHRGLQDGRGLPNASEKSVAVRLLVTGDPMLFLPKEIPTVDPREVQPPNPQDWIRIRDRCRAANLDYIAVLVPSKYTVYRPLVRDDSSAPGREVAFIDECERRLREARIPVINLSRALREAAERRITSGDFVYWRDDSHWNAEGVRVGAEEVVRQWKALR